jgi:hypothetical protein
MSARNPTYKEISGPCADGTRLRQFQLDLFVPFSFYSCDGKGKVMGLDGILSEISHMKRQIKRQQGDIRRLQNAGIDTASAELLLGRMQVKLESLVTDRDRLSPLPPPRTYASGKVIHGTPSHRR